eukprot:1635437-Rhodomonas_salina.3
MQLIHDRWGHPSNSKMEQIVRYYKRKGFPPGFLAALKKFKCKICAMCKDARVYKHTKHVQEKIANNKAQRKAQTSRSASKNVVQALLDHEVTEIESEEDLEHMLDNEELHMDYAHSISLGYFKERYYLLFVVGGRNFMWATPTTTRMEPEDLLNDFLVLSKINIGKIRTDNEFVSTKFKAYCKKRGIVLCPSVAYTHTMQARAEGAVRICKNQVRCALKASNAPPRFWPFALLHFCRTFNYWPGANSPLPWTTMAKSNFSFNIERDLHPFCCYMVAKLHSDHPLVSVNKTHADRGLEGAFLGWHDSTPSCYMYSFRLQHVLRVQDAVFDHDDEYPFLPDHVNGRSSEENARD